MILNFLAEDLLGEHSDDSLKSLKIEVSKEIANRIFKAAREEGPTPRQLIERTIKEILVEMTRAERDSEKEKHVHLFFHVELTENPLKKGTKKLSISKNSEMLPFRLATAFEMFQK